MKATVRNMQTLCERNAQPVAVPGVFAYCPVCGERYSASPGDYFDYPDADKPLTCCDNPMILAFARTTVHPVK